jgi:hypothetical protein
VAIDRISVTLEGGDRMKEYLAKLGRRLTKKSSLSVGFLGGDDRAGSYPGGGLGVAAVAAIQEFGAPRAPVGPIPPRPYFRTMIKKQSPHWGPDLGHLLKTHNFDSELALMLMGENIRGQLQQSIVDTNTPPLSKVTLMLRKMKRKTNFRASLRKVREAIARVQAGESVSGVSTKPLVESAHMLNSVDFRVD